VNLTNDFLRIGYYRLALDIFNPNISGLAIDIGGNASGVLQQMWPKLSWHFSPAYPEFDVQKMTKVYPAKSFDFAFLDQVLEHVEDPELALKQVWLCLKPGGFVYVATPFLIHVHPDPSDYYRWTRQGLNVLIKRAGFTKTNIGSWGNSRAAVISAKGWPNLEEVIAEFGEEEANKIIEENDISRPIVVFGSGEKTLGG
jgi:ubiquinone/menaquinone biosynthesis C-methylase UbiE